MKHPALSLVFCALSLTAEPLEPFDYCTIKCNNGNNSHTMCEYPDEISDFCVSFELQTDNSKPNLIDLHNSYRNDYAVKHKASNMQFLTWDDELEEIATRWVEQCIDDNDECRNVARFEVSQNVGVVQFDQARSHMVHHPAIFQMWTYEEMFCKPKKMKRWNSEFHEEKCGHLTNIIWAAVTRFACADAIYMVSNSTVQRSLVCNYGPAGNVPGQRIFLKGKPCSQCPNGTRCFEESKYPNLCALVKEEVYEEKKVDHEVRLRSIAGRRYFRLETLKTNIFLLFLRCSS